MATKLPGRAFGHDHVETQESCKQLTHTLPRVRSGRFKLLGLIKHHAYLRLLKNRSTLVGKAVALSRCASVNRTRRPTSPAHRSRVSPATQPHRQRAPVVGAATHSASAQLTSAWLAAGWGVLPVSHGQVACCRWLPGLPFEVRRAWSIVAVISPPAAPSRGRAEAVPRSSTPPPPLLNQSQSILSVPMAHSCLVGHVHFRAHRRADILGSAVKTRSACGPPDMLTTGAVRRYVRRAPPLADE